VPTGTTEASTSRVSVLGSEFIIEQDQLFHFAPRHGLMPAKGFGRV
jgi:hypothetical protein